MTARITIGTSELTAIVRVQRVSTPEPVIDKLHLVEDGFEIFISVFHTHFELLYHSLFTGELLGDSNQAS